MTHTVVILSKTRGLSPKFLIRSGKVRIPSDFKKNLCNSDNKERLFCLIEVWVENKELIGNCIVYFARGEKCLKITCDSYEEVRLLSLKI